MSAQQNVYSPLHFKFYSSFGADTDLQADGPVYQASKVQPCRRITPFSAGNLVVQRPDGTNITITGVVFGQTLDLQCNKIISVGTTITAALVGW